MATNTRQAPLVLLIHQHDGDDVYGPYLTQAGFRVTEAHTSTEGLSKAIAVAPDFIVLDFDLDGETTRLLKSDATTAAIPVIALASLEHLHAVSPRSQAV